MVNGLFAGDPNGTWAVLKIDLANAFNSMRRHSIQQALSARCPELLAWFLSTYATPSPLYVQDHQLTSSTGVQQGDPLGPLYFSLGLHSLLESLETLDDCSPLWQVWYVGP